MSSFITTAIDHQPHALNDEGYVALIGLIAVAGLERGQLSRFQGQGEYTRKDP